MYVTSYVTSQGAERTEEVLDLGPPPRRHTFASPWMGLRTTSAL